MRDRVALVTGAGSGIGRAVALAFAAAGATVVVGDIDPAGGMETVRLVQAAGGKAVYRSCEVSRNSEVQALVDGTVEKFGRLDFACNIAGIHMASLAGMLAEPGCYAYVASKHGILGLTKTAAFDYAKAGIRINAVCPAGIDTPGLQQAPEELRQKLRDTTPVGRIGTPEEVAAAVLWLCSDSAGFVTGTGIVMDGGVSTV